MLLRAPITRPARSLTALAKRGLSTIALALALSADGTPPKEFRLFVAGWNDTENGRFLFDAKAAAEVMAAHAKWGVDLAIDLEHQMLDEATADPTARDARGWCRLELRPDGSLWAVGVSWTPDGSARLTERRQRYVSPAFAFDPDTRRVTALINVAITSTPATHDTPALVAASATGAPNMDPKLIAAALDALIAGDTAKCAELLKGIIAGAAGGDADAATEDAPPPAGDGGADESTEMAADPAKKEDQAAVMAATSRLTRITGKSTIGDAVDEVEVWRKSHLELEAETAKLAKERESLELSRRKENAVMLTKLGAETPFTSGLGSASKKLCKRLLDEPLVDQNARVAALLAAKGGKLPTEIQPPPGTETPAETTIMKARTAWGVDGEVEITAAERARHKTPESLEKYASAKLGIQLRSVQTARKAS